MVSRQDKHTVSVTANPLQGLQNPLSAYKKRYQNYVLNCAFHTIYCDEVKDVLFGNTGVKNTKNDKQYASQLFTVQYSKIHEIKSGSMMEISIISTLIRKCALI